MRQTFETTQDLEWAIQALTKIEPRFAPVLVQHGVPSLRATKPSLTTLLQIVTEQFLSLKAADAIWQRVTAHLGEFSAQHVLDVHLDTYLALGLSRSKAKCFHACAQANIDFSQTDPKVMRAHLLKIWGIGPWTADVFLLSAMSLADAWPSGDVALQVAVQNLFALEKRPKPNQMEQLALPWQPYRAAAARLLWSHYRGLKGLAPA